MKVLLAVIVVGMCCLTARGEDWTVAGKDYHNVKVGQVEPDRVHISYDGGVGTVMLSDLTPELQKRFGYDPVAARAAEHQRQDDQSLADAQLAAEAKQQASQAAKAPKMPLTFEEKVEAEKARERAQLQLQIKALTDQIEYTKVLAAAHSGAGPALRKQYSDDIASLQKQIAQFQAQLDQVR